MQAQNGMELNGLQLVQPAPLPLFRGAADVTFQTVMAMASVAQAAAEKNARQALRLQMQEIKKEAAEGKITQLQLSEQAVAAEQKLQAALGQAAGIKVEAERHITAAVRAKEKLNADMKEQNTAVAKATASEKEVRTSCRQ